MQKNVTLFTGVYLNSLHGTLLAFEDFLLRKVPTAFVISYFAVLLAISLLCMYYHFFIKHTSPIS